MAQAKEAGGRGRHELRVGFAYVSACSLNWIFLMKCVISPPSTPLTDTVHWWVWSTGIPRGRSLGSIGYAMLP